MRILMIEDEKRLALTVVDLLKKNGYQTEISHDGEEGLALMLQGEYDAVILDGMLPSLDGYEVLRQARREKCMTPVLMLTARCGIGDKVKGLDCGADYYLTKPFDNEELLACLRAVMRRTGEILSDTLEYADLVLTPEASLLACGDRSVPLSAKELELMRLLMLNHTRYLPKETVLIRVWGYDAEVNMNSVEAYISFLRKKMHLLGSKVRIQAVRNIGYRLEDGT